MAIAISSCHRRQKDLGNMDKVYADCRYCFLNVVCSHCYVKLEFWQTQSFKAKKINYTYHTLTKLITIVLISLYCYYTIILLIIPLLSLLSLLRLRGLTGLLCRGVIVATDLLYGEIFCRNYQHYIIFILKIVLLLVKIIKSSPHL